MPDDTSELSPRTLIRERNLARRWNKSIRFLQRLRAARCSPPWLRIGATVYYRAEDILAFEAAQMRDGADG